MQHSVSQDDISSDAKLTRALLFCGVVAGPLYVIVGAITTFVILAFTVAVVLGWAWVSAVAARLLAELARAQG